MHPILFLKYGCDKEKYLKSQKELIKATEEKQKKVAALTEAWKTLAGMNG